jgi:predicted phosphodiesterase
MTTLALITDTHTRPTWDDGQLAFPSDASHNERSRITARIVRSMQPDAVIHIGDVVHPIPTLPSHADALAQAKEIYSDLGGPLLVVAGNHDVGDKRASINAPVLATEARAGFEALWGRTWRSTDVGPAHIVLVDGGLLGLDSPEAEAQKLWLEADLAAAAGRRVFVFTHYPPFLCDPDEPEHYDNLAPEPRRWLLELLAATGVEAVFSGHVHRFFYNQYAGIDMYTIPAVAFVRPEYSNLRDVAPTDAEYGRDDRIHLGLARLTLHDDGHDLEILRPHSPASGPYAPPRPLGCWLRRRLGARAEIPPGDLDALTRKVARDDGLMVAVRDLGLGRIRIPLEDLAHPDVVDRVRWLSRCGVAVSAFSAGLPTGAQRAAAEAHDVDWEVVIRPADVAALVEALEDWDGPALTVGRIGRPYIPDGSEPSYFSHFPRQGFHPADPAVAELSAVPGIARIAFRGAAEAPLALQIEQAVQRAKGLGVAAAVHVEIPFATEATRQDDDALVTARVLDADAAARAHPDAWVMLDLLVDKDRGYWPRNALIDCADWPRPAYVALKQAR